MSTKFLASLILIGTISGLFLLYFYFFVGYTSTLSIEANISDYEVELYNKKIVKTFDYTCGESPCILRDISPFDYNLRIRKEGYKTIYQDIKIPSRETVNISINAIKEIELSQVDMIEEISNKDRVSYLRDKKRAYRFFDFTEGRYAYFSEAGGLYVYQDSASQKIGDFSFNDSDILDVKDIVDTDYLYFQIGEVKYLYHLKRGVIRTLDLTVNIDYIKQGETPDILVFITSVGAYKYNLNPHTFEYFYIFRDFIYIEDSYIGVIGFDEEKKLQNFGLEDNKSNLIIRYNPLSKEKEVLYETGLDIDRIYLQDGGIYFESEGKRYELENL